MTMPSPERDAWRGDRAKGANAGAAADAHCAARSRGPRRRCFVTRRTADKSELIRFALGPDNAVVPDIAGKLPGRGLWLSADRNVIHTACARNVFAKAFRTKVAVEADMADQIERQLARRCLDFLGLARRAGAAVAGFEKVRALLASGATGVLVMASDGAEEGCRRLSRMGPGVRVVTLHTAAELSAALGREHAVYVALKRGHMADRFVAEAARLAGFRPQTDAAPIGGPEGSNG